MSGQQSSLILVLLVISLASGVVGYVLHASSPIVSHMPLPANGTVQTTNEVFVIDDPNGIPIHVKYIQQMTGALLFDPSSS